MKNEIMQRLDFADTLETLMNRKVKVQKQLNFDYREFINRYSEQQSRENAESFANYNPIMHPESSYLEFQHYAESLAAVSGKFSPEEINIIIEARDKWTKVSSGLAAQCIITPGEELGWELNRTRKTQVLRAIMRDNMLSFFKTQSLPSTDSVGIWIRKILFGTIDEEPKTLDQASLHALRNAVETLADLDISKPSLNEINKLIHQPGILDEYKTLTQVFVGRVKELDTLNKFLNEKLENSFWEGLILTGMGGVGKSSLLAKWLELQTEKKMNICVILDFDRPGINMQNRYWLAEEILRQVGAQLKPLGPAIDELINQSRSDLFISGGEHGKSSDDSSQRRMADRLLLGMMRSIKEYYASDSRPSKFLLVLDTLEEVTRNDDTKSMFSWLNNLGEYVSGMNLKVVFSGRLFGESLDQLKKSKKGLRHLFLSEFDTETASVFMANREFSAAQINDVLADDLIPRRPLELKLVLKLVSEGEYTIASLKKELKENIKKGKTNDLTTGILYRRVLLRIPDKEVRAIAYPGLILRYLTPDLVRFVLQPALGLKKYTDLQAKELINRLGKYNWLTYKEGGKVWHQKELRRAMLHMMLKENSKEATAIRRFGIKYFKEINDKQSKAEVVYLKLLGATTKSKAAKIDINDIRQSYNLLQPDRADFSKPADVLVEFAVKKKIPLEELKYLPDDHSLKIYHATGRELFQKRKISEAYALIKSSKVKARREATEFDDLLDNWEDEVMFIVGNWAPLRGLSRHNLISNPITPITIVNALFPRTIVQSNSTNKQMVEYLFKRLIQEDQYHWSKYSLTERESILSRLAPCVVMLDGVGRLNLISKKSLAQFLKVVSASKLTIRSYNSLSLLLLVTTGKPYPYYAINPDDVRLDKKWLNELSDYTHRPLAIKLRRAAQLLTEQKQYGTQKWKTLDLELNELLEGTPPKNLIKLLEIPGRFRTILFPGPSIIFREAVLFTVGKLLTSKKGQSIAPRLFEPNMEVGFYNAVFSKTVNLENTDPQQFENAIEVVDRSWNLQNFVSLAYRYWPVVIPLNLIRQAIFRYNKHIEKLTTKLK